MAIDYSKIAENLDALLSNVDLSQTTEEGVKTKIPDGYYLVEVTDAELGESQNGNVMVSFIFTTIGDGKKIVTDENGYTQLVDSPHTDNKRLYTNYVLSNDLNIGFFVSDMLKFQDPDTEEPLFTKDDFKSTKGIIDVCDFLRGGATIYVNLQTVERKNEPGKFDQKVKPISWARAKKLELI